MGIVIESIPTQSNDTNQMTTQSALTEDSIQHMAIANRYIDGDVSDKDAKKLRTIYEFAMNKAKSADVRDVIWEVINLEGTVGTPRLGENKLDRVYRYCQLRREEAMIQNELKELHNV